MKDGVLSLHCDVNVRCLERGEERLDEDASIDMVCHLYEGRHGVGRERVPALEGNSVSHEVRVSRLLLKPTSDKIPGALGSSLSSRACW